MERIMERFRQQFVNYEIDTPFEAALNASVYQSSLCVIYYNYKY